MGATRRFRGLASEMPDPADQWPDNVGGASVIDGRRVCFYVDRECIEAGSGTRAARMLSQ